MPGSQNPVPRGLTRVLNLPPLWPSLQPCPRTGVGSKEPRLEQGARAGSHLRP